MPFPRVVPHSDRSGVIGAVGAGVEPRRVGQRVWVYGPQAYSPFGTTARLNSVIGGALACSRIRRGLASTRRPWAGSPFRADAAVADDGCETRGMDE
jgi:hypothetical protein